MFNICDYKSCSVRCNAYSSHSFHLHEFSIVVLFWFWSEEPDTEELVSVWCALRRTPHTIRSAERDLVRSVFCYHQVCGLLICEGLKNPVVCTRLKIKLKVVADKNGCFVTVQGRLYNLPFIYFQHKMYRQKHFYNKEIIYLICLSANILIVSPF